MVRVFSTDISVECPRKDSQTGKQLQLQIFTQTNVGPIFFDVGLRCTYFAVESWLSYTNGDASAHERCAAQITAGPCDSRHKEIPRP